MPKLLRRTELVYSPDAWRGAPGEEKSEIPVRPAARRVGVPYRLTEEILALSEAPAWDAAKGEWDLYSLYTSDPDEPGTCLCGHTPIRHHCVLLNRLNGNTAVVGNCCVKRCLGVATGKVFAGLAKIRKDPAAAPSPALVAYAKDRGWLTAWEVGFLVDVARRRGQPLTDRQRAVRVRINQKVLAYVAADGRGVAPCRS